MTAVVATSMYDPGVRERFDAAYRTAQDAATEQIRAGQAAGFIRPELHAREAAGWLTWMAERGMTRSLVQHAGRAELRRLEDTFTAILWHTLYDGQGRAAARARPSSHRRPLRRRLGRAGRRRCTRGRPGGAERARHVRGDPGRIQPPHRTDLVAELDRARPADDHVELLRLPVAVHERRPLVGLDPEVRHAGALGLERRPREARLPAGVPPAPRRDVVDVGEVDVRVVGHAPQRNAGRLPGLQAMELEFTNLLSSSRRGSPPRWRSVWSRRSSCPAVVLELVLGIVIGPAVLGWVEVDDPVEVLSLIGLAILLFLAGLEIEFDMLRGRR